MEVIIGSWVIFALVIGYGASTRGHSGVSWFLFALVFSPLIALIGLLLVPNKRQEALLLAAATPPSSPIGVADELTKLAALRDSGVITEDEFARQRAALMIPSQPTYGPASQAGANMACGKCGKPLSPVWRGRCEHCKAPYETFAPVPRS